MDIEDLANTKLKNPSEINIKKRHKYKQLYLDEHYNCYHNDPSVPPPKKVHIKTFGCSHNVCDAEYMMGLLYESGYDIVENVDECDICIVNSCTVKNPSQDAFITYVTKSKNHSKPVIVCGCVPQGDRNLKGMENCSMLGLTQLDKVVYVVEETLKGNIVILLTKSELPNLDLPKIRRSQYIDIIPINMGCLGSCTYCKTKHARGKLMSYFPTNIIESCEVAYKNGVKELWVTSEDTGVYGRDIGTDLPSLMIKILKSTPKDVMIRIGMANPPYIMENLDKMVKVLNHPNVFAFLHIPVQSGSNNTLDKMIREYTIEDFEYVCDYLKQRVKDITIATDIICGFPTETKEDFEETLELIKKYKFPVLNISQFYPRPGTVAAKWKKVESSEVKRRSTAVANLFKSYDNYNHLLNTEQLVWFNDDKEECKNIKEHLMVGHTKSYVKVLVDKNEDLLGKYAKVKITGIQKWHVLGHIVDYQPTLPSVVWEEYFKGMIDDDVDYEFNKVKLMGSNIKIDKHKNHLRRKNAWNKYLNKLDINNIFTHDFVFNNYTGDNRYIIQKKTVHLFVVIGICFVLFGVGCIIKNNY